MEGTRTKLIAEALPAYEIGDEIGKGAWGVVLAGRHRHLHREVAIKQLNRDFGEDDDVRSRFISEARLLASLDHPHVVPIHDYVERDGLCLLVMERLTGGTVGGRFRDGALSPEAACAATIAACAGLDHAHGEGILHRDVKPDNLMFSSRDVLKVTDFGIAKVVGGSASFATRTGMIMGTPAYIAPEQATGDELTPATDVYSTGTVLYELLAGRLPFPDVRDPIAAIYQRVHEQPTPLEGAVPHDLAEVVLRAISRDPDERPQSAREFGAEVAGAARSVWGEEWLDRSGLILHGAAQSQAEGGPDTESGGARVTLLPRAAPASDPPRPRRWPLAAALAVTAAAATALVVVLADPFGAGSEPEGPPAAVTAQGPEAVVRGFVEAYNEVDFTRAAGFLPADIPVQLYEEEVRGVDEIVASLNAYGCGDDPDSLDYETTGDRVLVTSVLTDLPGRDCGEFTGTTSRVEFTVEGGKITSALYR